MKTVIKLSTVAGLLFTVAVGMAKEPNVKLISKGAEKSLVFQMDAKAKETYIKLIDDNDNVIFKDKVSLGNYAKRFNLSALPNGRYYFSTENAIKLYVYTLSVNESELILVDKSEKAKPVFRKKGDRLFLNLLNLDENKVDIKVIDSSDRVVFKETIEDESIIEKAFNFEKAYEDRYMVVVKDNNDVYYEYVLVK
ncbi:hypothetical protein [Muriicola sp. Z0-33]|uniref:hypothetical protein n=1 Tax=Muriicola sp. Z0-33 TaxID=2816957 RepID=UPI0022389F96|nr:hypothetical protein [Muriicola sp. Z0-33]MCW5517396.1 hypothetical protein [Muriicola sp. Z0-33]